MVYAKTLSSFVGFATIEAFTRVVIGEKKKAKRERVK